MIYVILFSKKELYIQYPVRSNTSLAGITKLVKKAYTLEFHELGQTNWCTYMLKQF